MMYYYLKLPIYYIIIRKMSQIVQVLPYVETKKDEVQLVNYLAVFGAMLVIAILM